MNVRVNYARDETTPVAPDAVVPCATEVLDENRLLEELARAFPERSFSEPTKVLDVTYTPRRRLAASFEVADAGIPQIVAVSTDGVNGARPAHHPADSPRILDGWGAMAWRYPADPELPALTRLTDMSAMSGVVRWLAGAANDVTDCMPLRYLPGERCVIRAIGTDMDIVARHASHDDAQLEHERLRWLWDHPERSFRMAEPLGFDDRLRTRFERTVAGRRSDAASILGRSIPLRRLCNELGALHALPHTGVTPSLRRLGSGAILGRIERTVVRRLRMAFPDAGDALSAYMHSLRTAAGELSPSADVTLHGDLHGGNLILDEDGPVLVGLDSPACGDPAFDLALLGSSLFLAAIERGASVARVATMIEELPWVYAEITGTAVLGDTYAWHLAAALVGWQADAALQVLVPRADALTATLLNTAIAVLRDGANAASMTSFAD